MFEELISHSQSYIALKNEGYHRYSYHLMRNAHRLSILLGPRGIGKTTQLIQYVWEKNNADIDAVDAVYIQVDHFQMSSYPMYEIAETLSQHGTVLLCLDEIHKYPNWSQELKSIYDSFPTLNVIASGSAALEISKGTHDLSRRALIHRMHELSFREYLEMNAGVVLPKISLEDVFQNRRSDVAKIISMVEEKNNKILPLFKSYLSIGAYPYFREMPNHSSFYDTLEQQIHTVIEADILSVYPNLSGAAVGKIKRLLKVIAESAPFIPNLTRLRQGISISDERTLKFYLKALEDAGLIRTISKSGLGLKQLEFPEKIYLANTNLAYALGRKKSNIGNLRETFMMMMLGNLGSVFLPKKGDFSLSDGTVIEVGGKNKDFKQISGLENAYLAVDDIEIGYAKKIPLWRFRLLY